MTNLLCGRGYFVKWGDDTAFRPKFLTSVTTVPTRSRFRLMEYSPTAEMNQIYSSTLRPITSNSKMWFQEAVQSNITTSETTSSRAFTRPIAENILLLIISPQVEVPPGSTAVVPTGIAPNYIYDSTLTYNPGGSAPPNGSQGTQHLLPPLVQVTMVALDQMAGEKLANDTATQQAIMNKCNGLFQKATNLPADLHQADGTPGQLEQLLLTYKLNYRVFSTIISIKQSRWSL